MKNTASRLTENTSRKILAGAMTLFFCVMVFLLLWGFGKFDLTGINTATPTGLAQKIACCAGISLLLGAMLLVLFLEYLRDSDSPAEEQPVWFYPVLSGFLSLAVMCVAYSFVGMWPMGEKTGMIVDMHHQYAPLLSGLRDAILGGDLSTYSFEVGMGANYISLFGYYLASPLNLFLLIFPERLLAEGILFVTLLKNALTGGLFALCVQTIFRRKSLCVPMVSVMYSMMMYLLAYSWNIMWLDVVMVLPLVILGFERLMRTGKYLTYVLSLAYCLFANYYIAFMLCIFLVLYYVAYVLRSPRSGTQVAVSFGRFAGFSVLAAGLTAFMLIPVYLALQSTSAAGADLPDLNSSVDIFRLIGRHLVGVTPTIRSGNFPNMYCGVLTAFCVPLFALNKGISRRRRAVYMALWLVLSLSFLINWTDLAWHGLHSPNDLPYRFSFVYSFFILLMAFETLSKLKHIELKHVFATFAGAVAYLMIEEHFGDEAYTFEVIYANLAVLATYALILALATRRLLRRRVAYALLLLVVTAEMVLGGGVSFVTINGNEYYTGHANYVDNAITESIRLAVDRAQDIGDEKANGDFYRMELLPRRTCVDTALFHYRGITSFSSSNYYTTTKLMGGLGYAINGVNSHLYHSFVPFTDSLLGIRYVLLQARLTTHPQLTLLDSVSYGGQNYYIYENTDALGVGYVADSAVKEYTYTKYNPIVSQELLFNALTGLDDKLYTLCAIEADGNGIGSTSYNESGFYVSPTDGSESTSFTATIPTGGQLFLYADCGAADAISISYASGDGNEQNGNSWSVTPYEPYIIDGGVVQAGATVTMTVTSDSACSGNFYVAMLNTEAYEKGMAVLANSQLKITEFDQNSLVGTVNADRDGVLTTSIPYDAGWKVTVDGKAVETYGINDGFLAFDITTGAHTIAFEYTPNGLLIGAGISAVSLIVLIVLLLVSRARKARPAPMEECLDYESARPVQEGFSVNTAPMSEQPPLPETLEELTGIVPEAPAEQENPDVTE